LVLDDWKIGAGHRGCNSLRVYDCYKNTPLFLLQVLTPGAGITQPIICLITWQNTGLE